jgi:hypothetical protein
LIIGGSLTNISVIVVSRRKKAILDCLSNFAFNGIPIENSSAELYIELYISKTVDKKNRIDLKERISSELCSSSEWNIGFKLSYRCQPFYDKFNI